MHKGRYGFKNKQLTGLHYEERLSFPSDSLRHRFCGDGKIKGASETARPILDDAKAAFFEKYGHEFDKYLPSDAELMRPIMLQDGRMPKVLEMLGLDYSKKEKLYLPWWIEEAGKETGFAIKGETAIITIGSRHSYQTQFMRMGEDIPGMNSLSVVGLVLTSDNKLAIGLRSGVNLRNTYYYCAGAMKLSASLKEGKATIYEIFRQGELAKEYGLSDKDVSDAQLLSKVAIHGGDRDISYVFLVKTRHAFSDVEKIYFGNRSKDKAEHFGLEPLDASPKAIIAFVERFYRGVVENDPKREYKDRLLLPQGAAPLLHFAGEKLELLEKIAAGKRTR